MLNIFAGQLQAYLAGILPVLLAGFLVSGAIREFASDRLVRRGLAGGGLKPVFFATVLGALLPVCCWGSLPIAVTLSRKGAGIGPVLAFLVATPATSATSLLVSARLLGIFFASFEFLGVIAMGLFLGAGGGVFFRDGKTGAPAVSDCCASGSGAAPAGPGARWRKVLRYALFDLPREIGPEILAGILLAALVVSAPPVGRFVSANLAGGAGYLFSLVFGLLVYVCATATVPLVHAFVQGGLEAGAGMVLLLFGPVTSYGTILVLRKSYGNRVLAWHLAGAAGASLALGYLFSLLRGVFR